MIIDFHTHVFPDKIAKKAVEKLALNGEIPNRTDGTVDGLLRAMDKADVSLAVTLPVATSPSQFDSINAFAASVNSTCDGRIISFAGIHPRCEDIEGKMRFIKQKGFKGVKIHPDYQSAFITDEGYIKILQCARELDLIVTTHAGVDDGFKGQPVKCTPEMAIEVIKKVPGVKLVLAHLGANKMLDRVQSLICGQNVYLDTSFVAAYEDKRVIERIITAHGADKILFASDSPWNDISEDVQIISSLNLTPQQKQQIFYKNASKLLGL